jgi:energy-coupling factor transport system substrate-specific component
MIRRTTSELLSVTTYAVMSMVGIVAFLYPFWLPSVQTNAQSLGHTDDAPFMTALLICLCLAALFLDAQANGLNTKTIALLGVLIAMNSVLRFIEVSVPGPGGFTPIFFLIILSGVVFGARFGFLMGSLTLLISALITGGVGAWLPYQMFTAGWMGLSAGWLGKVFNSRFVLVLFGAVWGFLYGAIMNIWFWPFATGSAAQYWQPGMSLSSGLQRYAAFYLATSLVWDLFAALGNVLLIVFFGEPTLRVLRRFKSRFTFLVTT